MYEERMKGKMQVIRKRYKKRMERNKRNLRKKRERMGRK
ncbi:hypothetical protein DAH34_28030 [Escherichia coli]|nr:hypothetical protein DAH34_28030 [Escherichia coli]